MHVEEPPGDILVFLTGQEEIEAMDRLLQDRATRLPPGTQAIAVTPIFAALPSVQQLRAFRPPPPGARKVILATNIAETSVTIPGVRYVIDPGLVKARAFDARIGVESLAVTPISKAQARQRSGRAGREAPGKCFRLYTEAAFEQLRDATPPEILRCNLAAVALQLTALGIRNLLAFDFMDPPPRAAIAKALEQLYTLGALTGEGHLSRPLGEQMARFPLDPLYSRAVLAAARFRCAEEMLTAVAMLSVENAFFAPKDKLAEAKAARQRFVSREGDHVTLVNVFRAYHREASAGSPPGAPAGPVPPGGREQAGTSDRKSKHARARESSLRAWCHSHFLNGRALKRGLDVYRQLRGYCEGLRLEVASCGDDFTPFRRCLAASFFLHAARRQPDGTYRALASGQTVAIHPSSVLLGRKPECVVFNELVRTTRQYIRDVTRIDATWLAELAPQFYRRRLLRDGAAGAAAGAANGVY